MVDPKESLQRILAIVTARANGDVESATRIEVEILNDNDLLSVSFGSALRLAEDVIASWADETDRTPQQITQMIALMVAGRDDD